MKKKITKRIFTLLLAAMLMFPLISCGGKAPEVNDPEPNTPVVPTPSETQTPEQIEPRTWSDFETNYFEVKPLEYDGAKPSANAIVVHSQAELLTLYEGLTEEDAAELQNNLKAYDDAYFENHTLILVEYFRSGNVLNPNIHKVELTKDQNETALRLEVTSMTTGTVASAKIHSYITLSIEEKIDVDSSEKIEVYFSDWKMS